jgi:hypothetical protein
MGLPADFPAGSTISGIDHVGFGYPATVAGSYSAGSTTIDDTVDMSAATLNAADPLPNLYLGTTGELEFAGAITTTGLFTWVQGGKLTGVGGAATLTAAGGMQLIPYVGGSFAPYVLENCTLVNPATATGSNASVVIDGGVLDNLPGATFLGTEGYGNTITLSNSGTLTGGGTVNAFVNNLGVVAPGSASSAGILTLNNGYYQDT